MSSVCRSPACGVWCVVAAVLSLVLGAAEAAADVTATFPATVSGTYQQGSGQPIPFDVYGTLPGGSEVTAEAWSDAARQRIALPPALTSAPWRIEAAALDALPPGRTQLRIGVRNQFGRTELLRTQWVEVKAPQPGTPDTRPQPDPTPDVELEPEPTPEPTPEPEPQPEPEPVVPTVGWPGGTPTVYRLGSNASIPFHVSSALVDGYNLLVLAQTAEMAAADSAVIADFTLQLKGEGPWSIPASKLEALPTGPIRLQLLLRKNAERVQKVYHTITVVPNQPRATFTAGTPSVYVKGSGVSFPFAVEGGAMPEGTNVLVLAQTPDMIDTAVVSEFSHSVKGGGPFMIAASKLETLPTGLVRLQLLCRDQNGGNYSKVFHWIKVETATTGGDGEDPTLPTDPTDPQDPADPTDPTDPTDPNHGGGGGGETGDPNDGGDPQLPDDDLPQGHPFLGINLNAPGFWSTQWDFANAYRMAKGWENDTTYLFWDSEGRFPKGRWILEWDGADTLSIGSFKHTVVERDANRLVFDADPQPENNGIRLMRTGPDVRNVRLWMPGCAPEDGYGSQFHPLFLERLKPFKVLRFMDYQNTNGSPVISWGDRTLPTRELQGEAPGGVAIEIMVDLCNELNASPWFCMPHGADDDYIRRFAELVKARLKPGLRVYLEYSNECWNGQFDQHDWLKVRASGGNAMRQAGVEARRDFAIWYDVFGGSTGEAPKRLVRVAAGQANNPWQIEQMLEALEGEFDAIACAAYAGATTTEVGQFTSATTPEEVVEAARRQWRERLSNREEHAELARKHGVPFLAYEAGQHLSPYGRTVPWYDAYVAAQRHPAMYELYMEMLADFERIGGDLFVAYNYTRRVDKHGSWGHLEYQDQPLSEAPKYRALIEYLTSPERLMLTSGD